MINYTGKMGVIEANVCARTFNWLLSHRLIKINCFLRAKMLTMPPGEREAKAEKAQCLGRGQMSVEMGIIGGVSGAKDTRMRRMARTCQFIYVSTVVRTQLED